MRAAADAAPAGGLGMEFDFLSFVLGLALALPILFLALFVRGVIVGFVCAVRRIWREGNTRD